ncbi:MAG: glycosyltransferase [Muribaculaceae bacterium]|nr:glycosyltransferase [Muribaculaceae bacterium]
MNFSIDLTPLTWGLLAGAAVLSVVYVWWQWHRSRVLTRHVREDELQRPYAEELPPVSVIVDAGNETDQLMDFLPLVLHQDYPTMEVIVVADGSAESTSDLLSELKASFANLHITFTPHDMRSLSRKKLALMIGLKAAHYDVVLTTSANCRAASDQWLRTMMRNFVDGVDVVLGYSHYRYKRDRQWWHRYRVYDTVCTAVQWLTTAIQGHPYRGTSDNLAYRKHLFFDHHGFARCMELQWGEDDVWLSPLMTADNTRVELAPESQLSTYYDNMARTHSLLKMRRDFTSRFVRQSQFVVASCMSLAYYLRLAALIAAVALNPTNAVVLIVAALILIGTWIGTIGSMRRNCTLLQAPRLLFTVPFFTVWRPVVNLVYRLGERARTKSNYTTFA